MVAAADYAEWLAGTTPYWFLTGIEPNFTTISGSRAVIEALTRRFTTLRGGLVGPADSTEGNQGLDVRQFLNRIITPASLTQLRMAMILEAKKEERVDSVDVLVTFQDPKLTFRIVGTGSTGPFNFTLTVDQVTVDLLNNAPQASPPTTTLQNYGTDVTTYPVGGVPPLPADGIAASWGERFLRTIGTIADVIGEGARQAVKARFVALAPDDALPYIAHDRDLNIYKGESPNSVRARASKAWLTWPHAGTSDPLGSATPGSGPSAIYTELLAIAGLPNTWLLAQWTPGTPAKPDKFAFDTNADNWSRFWVEIGQPHPWTGTAMCSESLVCSEELICGISMTHSQYMMLRQAIHKYRPAHGLAVDIEVRLVDADVVHVGPGPTVTVSGTPLEEATVVLTITTGGVLGTSQFTYSLNGGAPIGPLATPVGGTFLVPGTGITATFPSGTYVLSDTYAWAGVFVRLPVGQFCGYGATITACKDVYCGYYEPWGNPSL